MILREERKKTEGQMRYSSPTSVSPSKKTRTSANSAPRRIAGGLAVLNVTADDVSLGLRPSLMCGQMVRIEAGKDLKSLQLWGVEMCDNAEQENCMLVIRDGHTLKRRVSWRPSANDASESLVAVSLVFVPAHLHATSSINAAVWTTWWNNTDRQRHQFIIFDPVTRQPLRALSFSELFGSETTSALYSVQPKMRSAAHQRGVTFAYERRAVQKPLIAFSSYTRRLYLVHQQEFKGSLDVVISSFAPHQPFCVLDTCRLPYPFNKENDAVASLIVVANNGKYLHVITARLHCCVVRLDADDKMAVQRTFRPRDFVNLAVLPSEAVAVSAEWMKAEMIENVILPEYFYDPVTSKLVSGPRRFDSQNKDAKKTTISTSSQRSSSNASTIPHHRLDIGDSSKDAARMDVAADGIDSDGEFFHTRTTAPRESSSLAPPPTKPAALVRAVNVMARLRATMIMSRYFSTWLAKPSKHPNFCVDGWSRHNKPILLVPIAMVKIDCSSLLQHCHDVGVELWVLFDDGEDIAGVVSLVQRQDSHGVVGQFVAFPERNNCCSRVYFRHVSPKHMLLVLPSVKLMTRCDFLGPDCDDRFVAIRNLLYCPSSLQATADGLRQIYRKLALVLSCCRRESCGRVDIFWDAAFSDRCSEFLSLVRECTTDGRGFVDLLAVGP